MDTGYMGGLFLSVAIFAPGFIVLVMGLFFGLLMILEEWKIFNVFTGEEGTQVTDAGAALAANPSPGEIVSSLKNSVDEEQSGVSERAAR